MNKNNELRDCWIDVFDKSNTKVVITFTGIDGTKERKMHAYLKKYLLNLSQRLSARLGRCIDLTGYAVKEFGRGSTGTPHFHILITQQDGGRLPKFDVFEAEAKAAFAFVVRAGVAGFNGLGVQQYERNSKKLLRYITKTFEDLYLTSTKKQSLVGIIDNSAVMFAGVF